MSTTCEAYKAAQAARQAGARTRLAAALLARLQALQRYYQEPDKPPLQNGGALHAATGKAPGDKSKGKGTLSVALEHGQRVES